MLALRRLLPSFKFSWWGETRMIKQSLMDPAKRTQGYEQKLRVLYTKARHAQIIADILKRGQAIHLWLQNNPLTSQDTDQSQKKQQQLKQNQARRLSTAEYIIAKLKKDKTQVADQDQKQAIQELICMFTPGSGHYLNREIYSQSRFELQENSVKQCRSGHFPFVFEPNPLLLKQIMGMIRTPQKHLLSGSFGIGKTTALALLTELYNTMSLYQYLKKGHQDMKSLAETDPVYKIFYISLEKQSNITGVLINLKNQCQYFKPEQKTSYQFTDQLPEVIYQLIQQQVQPLLVIDQINRYYSSVRQLFYGINKVVKGIQAEKGNHITQQGITLDASDVKAFINSQQSRQKYEMTLYSSGIVKAIDKYSLQQLNKHLSPSQSVFWSQHNKEQTLRFLLQYLFASFSHIICNSSTTIQTYLSPFCRDNKFFDIDRQGRTKFTKSELEGLIAGPQGQFVINKKFLFEIRRSLSHKKADRQSFELKEPFYLKAIEQLTWPTWTKHLSISEYIKEDQSDDISSLQKEVVSDSSLAAETLKNIKSSLIELFQKELLKRLKLFLDKGGYQQRFYKTYILKGIAQRMKNIDKERLQRSQNPVTNNNRQDSHVTITFQELNLPLPLFALQDLKNKTDEEKVKVIQREKLIMKKYFGILGLFQFFGGSNLRTPERTAALNVFCTTGQIQKIFQQVTKDYSYSQFLDLLMQVKTLGGIFDTYVTAALKTQGSGLTMEASPYGQEQKTSIVVLPTKKVVLFNEIMAVNDPKMPTEPNREDKIAYQKYEEQLEKKNRLIKQRTVESTILPIFQAALSNPTIQIIGLAKDPIFRQKLSYQNAAFDSMIVTYNSDRHLIQVFSIDWTVSLSLTDPGKIVFEDKAKGVDMEQWWKNRSASLLIHLIDIDPSIRVDFHHFVACPDQSFQKQSLEVKNMKPVELKRTSFNKHVANISGIKMDNVNKDIPSTIESVIAGINIHYEFKKHKLQIIEERKREQWKVKSNIKDQQQKIK